MLNNDLGIYANKFKFIFIIFVFNTQTNLQSSLKLFFFYICNRLRLIFFFFSKHNFLLLEVYILLNMSLIIYTVWSA